MVGKIFVNLPVKNLEKSMAFFKAIGFSFIPSSPIRRPPAWS